MKTKNLIFLAIFAIFALGGSLVAQTGVPIVIKGTILDLYTQKPCKLTMMFTDEAGKKFKIEPSAETGKYEQVLTSGQIYDVTFLNYDIFRESNELNIEFTESYKELKQDFKVRRMTNGLELYNTNIFNTDQASFSSEGEKLMQTVAKAMKYSRGAKLEFIISGKSQNLINERISTINNMKELSNVLKRITFSKGSASNDFRVIVQEIKDPLSK